MEGVVGDVVNAFPAVEVPMRDAAAALTTAVAAVVKADIAGVCAATTCAARGVPRRRARPPPARTALVLIANHFVDRLCCLQRRDAGVRVLWVGVAAVVGLGHDPRSHERRAVVLGNSE
jgi:hypothetical protein